MRRVWAGAIGLALVLVAYALPAHASIASEPRAPGLRVTGDVTRQLPTGMPALSLSALSQSSATAGSQVSAAALSSILSEGFETSELAFEVYGNGWAVTDYRKSAGMYSAYCAGAYAEPPGPYAPNSATWLVAGPFDLSRYSSAQISFDLWEDCQWDRDALFVGVSRDRNQYVGASYSGTSGGMWASNRQDISQYCGSPEVWITFGFSTDGSVESEGVYIDNISVTGNAIPVLNPVFRFYNFTNGTHFYTPSVEERDSVLAKFSNAYSYDGIAYYTSVYNNAQPLYRFYNRKSGGHFYTASAVEADTVRARWHNVFQYEGTTYAVNAMPVANSVPVYRFYNKKNGTHFYTASAEERDMVSARWPDVYSFEGTAFWVGQATSPVPVTPEPPEPPVDPIPDTLWQPSDEVLPDTGNYIYLDSEAGDYIGGGGEYLYTDENASIYFAESRGRIKIRVGGQERWIGDFQCTSENQPCFEVGYYPDVWRYPFHDPEMGGMRWTGEGRDSYDITGWFVVDSVTYVNHELTSIDLRFEQRAEEGAPPLHGKIHWTAEDALPTPPNGDPDWQPFGAVLPDEGNYVYLDSDIGDFIGAGGEYLYTPDDSEIAVSGSGGHLFVSVDGWEYWDGMFDAPKTTTQLEVGNYVDYTRYDWNDPASAAMEWGGEHRGCNTATGWLYVDNIQYVGGNVAAIDFRFEQHCEGEVPALHGKVHWVAEKPEDFLPGPVNPIPDGLWEPDPTILPQAGNYVYLDSDEGDYVGAGEAYLYTPEDSAISVTSSGGKVMIGVSSAEYWSGVFQTPAGVSSIAAGYYPGLTRYPFHDTTRGGFEWWGEGRGSNDLTGWVAVDSVTYTDGALTAIDLRFEQHSEGYEPALHGVVHWRAGG